jgi:hypothetical protein
MEDDTQSDIDSAAEAQAFLEQRRRYEQDVWSAPRGRIAQDLFTTPMYDRKRGEDK